MSITRKYFCEREPWVWDGCRIHAREYDSRDGECQTFALQAKIERVKVPEGILSEPMLTFYADEAQLLFDAMWNAGYRPNKGEASAAHVEAMKYHLEDMRKLVFEKRK